MKAWLVTWEWGIDDFDKFTDEERIADILNPRRSSEFVRRSIELLYVRKKYTLTQRMDWARKGDYQLSRFGSVARIRWDGQIFCGYNPPQLYARKVDDFRIERHANGKEEAIGTEKATLNMITLIYQKYQKCDLGQPVTSKSRPVSRLVLCEKRKLPV